jgi:DNA-binding transcriptional LysR family regulator
MRAEVRSLVLRSSSLLAPDTEMDLATLDRTFSLRCHDALTAVLAPTLVSRALRVAPRVSFRFLGEASEDNADLARGAIDLELGTALSGPADIDRDLVGNDRLVAIASRDTSLLGDLGTLAGFAAAPHVIVSRRGRLSDGVDGALGELGYSRRVVASVASTAAALEIVRDTDTVVTVPESVSYRLTEDDSLQILPLPIDVPSVPIVLAWHRRLGTDLAHQWLRTMVSVAVREMVGQGREQVAER